MKKVKKAITNLFNLFYPIEDGELPEEDFYTKLYWVFFIIVTGIVLLLVFD